MKKPNYSFERLQKQILVDLSEIVMNHNRNHFLGKMISVSAVHLTADKSIAKVYLSVYPSNSGEEVLNYFEQNKSQIRFELGNKIRHQVRRIPDLIFYLDKTFDEIEKIERLLKQASKNKDENSDKDDSSNN